MRLHRSKTVLDQVCGMKLDPCKTDLVAIEQGHRYYFCADACRKAFETNPQKYLVSKTTKHKGLWKRYLERLNKATGGKPPRCH